MTTQRVTIDLPEAISRQLVRIAEATHQSVEVLVAKSVMSNFPPSVEHASPELHAEFLKTQGLPNEELREITQSQAEAC